MRNATWRTLSHELRSARLTLAASSACKPRRSILAVPVIARRGTLVAPHPAPHGKAHPRCIAVQASSFLQEHAMSGTAADTTPQGVCWNASPALAVRHSLPARYRPPKCCALQGDARWRPPVFRCNVCGPSCRKPPAAGGACQGGRQGPCHHRGRCARLPAGAAGEATLEPGFAKRAADCPPHVTCLSAHPPAVFPEHI